MTTPPDNSGEARARKALVTVSALAIKAMSKSGSVTIGYADLLDIQDALTFSAEQNTGGMPGRSLEDGVKQFRKDTADEDGFWRTCSGCYECEDGYPNGDYPHSDALGCTLGGGCGDCGGIGAIWDTTDYEEMAAFMLAADHDDSLAATGGTPALALCAAALRARSEAL